MGSYGLREFVYMGRRLVEKTQGEGKTLAFLFASISPLEETENLFYLKEGLGPSVSVGAVVHVWATGDNPPVFEVDEKENIYSPTMFKNKAVRDEWLFQDLLAECLDPDAEYALKDAVATSSAINAVLAPLRKLVRHKDATATMREALLAKVINFLTTDG